MIGPLLIGGSTVLCEICNYYPCHILREISPSHKINTSILYQMMMNARWGLVCVFKAAETHRAPTPASVIQASPSTITDLAAMVGDCKLRRIFWFTA